MNTANTNPALTTETPIASEFNPFIVINILIRRFRMILGITLLSLILGGLYVSFQITEYTATAMLQLNVKKQPLLDVETMTFTQGDDAAAIQSELDIISSPTLIQNVVKKLNLDETAEFNDAYKEQTLALKLENSIHDVLRPQEKITPDPAQTQEIKMIRITRAVAARLSVRKDPLSNTVRISFTSEMPKRAQLIANAIVDEYINYQIETGAGATREANDWLAGRIEELRQKVLDSDRAVQMFSEQHNLFELDGKTLDDQQISQLNLQMVQARADLAQAEARLEHAKILLKSPDGIESVREVLNSGLIQSLREKEAELLRQRSELAGHFGPQHPAMQKINGEIEDLRSNINAENLKIIQGLRNELDIAKVRVRTLENELKAAENSRGDNSRLAVELSELKREAAANRMIYEEFLSRFKETGEQENLKTTTARIIAEASLPLSPSAPQKKLIMALFFFAGLCAGLALAILLEQLASGFSSPEQIEEETGLSNLGMIPELGNGQKLPTYVLQRPSSIHAEAIRAVLSGLTFNAAKLPRSALIISALPQEGKGWSAAAMARIAASSGKRILLIDGDLHNPKIGGLLGADLGATLNDYLMGEAEIKDMIRRDPQSGLHYIVAKTETGNIQALLESERMRELMDFAHKAYHLTLIDCPPVIGLSDVLYLSRLADTSLMITRWSKTPRNIVKNVLKILKRAQIDLAGIVLNRVDLAEYKKYEFGDARHYAQYKHYYRETETAPPPKAKVMKFGAMNR